MKILLTGNLFHDYERHIMEGLIELGHSVDLVFNNIHGPFNPKHLNTIPQWIMYGVLPHKFKINFFVDYSIESYNLHVQKLVTKESYDLMLVIGAKTISVETLSIFRGRKVLWFMDGISRYGDVGKKLHYFDDLFVFEPTDVDYIKNNYNLNAKFLTLAFSPRIYYPLKKEIRFDFAFVGSFYNKREDFLNEATHFSKKLCIYGDFYRSKYKAVRESNLKTSVSHIQANELYNVSKININIHHPQSKEGLSVRSFEILGAGGFQLVERQKAALEMFKENVDIAFYESKEEFVDKVRFYLSNDASREKVAKNGYEKAIRFHTWKHRLGELIQQL